MTVVKKRSVFVRVCETREHTSEIPETDLHGDTDRALGRTADVVSVPGNGLGYVGVYA